MSELSNAMRNANSGKGIKVELSFTDHRTSFGHPDESYKSKTLFMKKDDYDKFIEYQNIFNNTHLDVPIHSYTDLVFYDNVNLTGQPASVTQVFEHLHPEDVREFTFKGNNDAIQVLKNNIDSAKNTMPYKEIHDILESLRTAIKSYKQYGFQWILNTPWIDTIPKDELELMMATKIGGRHPLSSTSYNKTKQTHTGRDGVSRCVYVKAGKYYVKKRDPKTGKFVYRVVKP
jgi:hypothetical protein